MSRSLFSSIYHHMGRSCLSHQTSRRIGRHSAASFSTKRSSLPMLIFICLPASHHELCDLVHDALSEGRANSGHLCDLPWRRDRSGMGLHQWTLRQSAQPRSISAPPAASASSAATTWLMRTCPNTMAGRSRSGSREKRPTPYHARTAKA